MVFYSMVPVANLNGNKKTNAQIRATLLNMSVLASVTILCYPL